MSFAPWFYSLMTIPLALALALVFVPFVRVIASKYQIVSQIDFRRRAQSRPLMGGVAVFAAAAVANLVFNKVPTGLLVAAALLCVLGIFDDKFQLRSRVKMLCQIGAVGLYLWMTPSSALLLNRMGYPPEVAYALHGFWIVGLINAFNMIDGMDGLASGMAALAFFFLGIFLPWELRIFSWSLSIACVGFLVFNRPPATIFLGDAGSLVLGFLMSALGGVIETNHMQATSILVPLFILAHPEIDAILAMVRRYRAGTPLSRGDKDHIHHKMRRIGLGPHESLGVAYFATVFCGLSALLIDFIPDSATDLLAAWLAIAGVGSLLAGIYFTEFKFAVQFSALGVPLLHRSINMVKQATLPHGTYHAIAFDLFPYYKEIQDRGIADLNLFIGEFATWVNNDFRSAQVVPAGAYSIVVIHDKRLDEASIIDSFRRLCLSHGVLKNDIGMPWGLSFYTDSTDAQAFEAKFGAVVRAPVIDSDKAA